MEYALGLPLPRDFARFSVITSRERPQFVYRPGSFHDAGFPLKTMCHDEYDNVEGSTSSRDFVRHFVRRRRHQPEMTA